MNKIDKIEKSFVKVVCAGWAVLTVSLAQGGTVAYWPMVMDPATGGDTREIVDASGNGNKLKVNLTDEQAANTSDVAFIRPPNGPAEITASSCVEINNGTSLGTAPFGRGSSEQIQTIDPLILAMGLRHDFTIEGYMYVKSLKHPATYPDTVIAISGIRGSGDWIWNLTETAQNSNKRDVVVSIVSGTGVENDGILCTIDDTEILGGWHHYALVFKFNEDGSRSRWTFYLDGVSRGSKTMGNHGTNQNVQHDRFWLGGGNSSANKVFDAKLAFWRVSDEALTPPQFLCCEGNPLIWKGAVDSAEWSTGGVLNWTKDGSPVSWTDAKDAYFVDSYATNRIEITGTVNPASINAIANSYFKLDFDNARSSAIGAGCTNFVKYGLGTFEIYSTSKTALLNGACPIEVREGTLRVDAANSNGALGNAALGYEVKVYDNATLSLYARNVIGSAVPGDANDSVFTVYTNGTFDMSCASDSFNIQALGALDLLGGNFVAPEKCHALGYLLIRSRLTLGCNPGKQPYVFPEAFDQANPLNRAPCGITFGRNTEFRVEDVTGDAAADGIFNCAVLARVSGDWQDKEHPCGFRKTGGGTMELNNPYAGSSNNYHTRPTGVIAVEAGELKVNINYSSASKYTVADGAFLSGTGKVSRVEFAAGAGMRVDATKADVLELAGADFAGGGVIELSGVLPEDVKDLRVNCAKVGSPVTGAANLSGWKVKVDGEEIPRIAVRLHGGFLRTSTVKGLSIIFK